MILALLHFGRRPHLLVLAGALAIAAAPLIWPVHFIGRSGFFIIYALFTFGFVFARYRLTFPSSLAFPLFIAGATVTFFLRTGIEEFLLPADAAEARQALGKYYKFAFCMSIPIMLMATGVLGTVLRAAYSNAAIAHLGRASYSIYLWQQLATHVAISVSIPIQLLIVGAMIVGCILFYEIVEKRLIRIGRNIAEKQLVRG